MRSSQCKPNQRKSIFTQGKGFALTAALTLMVLLSMIAVAMMTLATSVSSHSARTRLTEEARAQARLALQIALGRLQAEMGPDQRISAMSGILSSESDEDGQSGVSNPYILGVWNSWDRYLNRTNSSGKKITDTYSTGRSANFRRWLISSADEKTLQKWDAVTAGGKLGRRSRSSKSNKNFREEVLLLGEGTLGSQSESKEVYAGLVRIDGNRRIGAQDGLQAAKRRASNASGIKESASQRRRDAGNREYIAWWITGENLKARVNLPQYNKSSSSVVDVIASQWNTPVPDSKLISGLENFETSLPEAGSTDYNKKISNIFTWGTMSLVKDGVSKPTKTPFYHDASLTSQGLLVDVKFGGLKKDLNMLMSVDDLSSTDYYENSNADVGIRPYGADDAEDSISNTNRPTASWKQMYYWYNLWDKSTKSNQGDSANLQWNSSAPYTTIAADPKDSVHVLNNRYTYVRQPVLLKMYMFVGFSISTRTVSGVLYPTGRVSSVRPVYVWWNPYNVPMDIGTKTTNLGAFNFSYRIQPMQTRILKNGGKIAGPAKNADLNEAGLVPKGDGYGVGSDGMQWKDSYRGLYDAGCGFYEGISDKKLHFDPGAIRVFTHDLAGSSEADRRSPILQRDGNEDHTFDKATKYTPGVKGSDISYTSSLIPNPVPVLTKYGAAAPGAAMDAIYNATDFAKYTLEFSMPEYKKDLKEQDYASQSVYQLFLAEDSNSDLVNFAIGAGLQSDSAASMDDSSTSQGDAIEQYFPSFFNINWVDGRPYSFIKGGIFQFSETLFNTMWQGWTANGSAATVGVPNPAYNPFWVSYFGISAKTVNFPQDDNARFPQPSSGRYSDMRNKSWLHANPTFWGSQLPTPDELKRKAHPYQYEIRQRDSEDMQQMSLEDIVGYIPDDKEGKAYFGTVNEDMVSTIVAAELPLHPIYGLAGFATMRLTPGWFSDDGVLVKGKREGQRAKRFAYQSGVPGVGVGNSFADPMISATSVHYYMSTRDQDLSDYWDHGFIVNDALWDSWFTSSLSNCPGSIGGSTTKSTEIVSNMLSEASSTERDVDKMMANNRFKLNKGLKSDSTVKSELNDAKTGFEKSAQYLVMDGAFNINSTSVEAWEAVLTALKNRQVAYMDANSFAPKILSASGQDDAYFTRFSVASHDESRYGQPMMKVAGRGDESMWSDLRSLTTSAAPKGNSDMTKLAKEIVKQIKQRGPFLNMSEFVNRRLEKSDLGLKGALQSAIDNAGLNKEFETSNMTLDQYSGYNYPEASSGSVQTASPGYLIQSDILAPLANSLTVRDDTFTIRAYGQVTDPSGKRILARAWCEATVQRSIDYVDPTNEPDVPAVIVDPKTGDVTNSKLSTINKAFGRKFKVVSFRWLSPDEV